jgi:hypothetical protein
MGPCGNGIFGLVDDPLSQSIEAGSKPGLLTTTVRFSSDVAAAQARFSTA